MKTIRFTETILIKQRAEVIFDYTQDYQKRLTWDTFLKKAELMEHAKQAAYGVKAYCVAKNGMGMETEYVSFNRPKVTAVKMTKGPYLFQSFLGSWTFKTTDSEQETEVVFLYAFTLRFPFTLFRKWIRHNLQQNVKQRLLDLKQYIENHPA